MSIEQARELVLQAKNKTQFIVGFVGPDDTIQFSEVTGVERITMDGEVVMCVKGICHGLPGGESGEVALPIGQVLIVARIMAMDTNALSVLAEEEDESA